MCRKRASLDKAVIIGKVNISCQRRTSFKKRTFVGRQRCVFLLAEGVGFEPTWGDPKRFSRPPRYDRFDNPPYMNCRKAEIIGYSIFFRNIFRNAVFGCFRSARKVSVYKAFLRFCDRYARKFSRPPRYDHFDIPP